MGDSIVCFGLIGTFDSRQIGGTDSYFRRLGVELKKRGNDVTFIHYGSKTNNVQTLVPDIPIYYYINFQESLNHIASVAKHVLVCGIHRSDRLGFIKFRRKYRHDIKFYFLSTLFCESWIRRHLHFLEMTLYPYNGGALCMSPRLVRACQIRGNKATLLLPPVPDSYYVLPSEKEDNGYLNVTFVGRPVPGKGGDDAIKILEFLSRKTKINTMVYGYVWPNGPEDNSIQNWLSSQNNIGYVEAKHEQWSPSLDIEILQVLKNTHILLLPYKRLSSSIDTPLLMLEGMASSCCILTRPLGDIPLIYGESPCLIRENNFVNGAIKKIEEMSHDLSLLQKERLRISHQVKDWSFSTGEIATKLMHLFRNC